ncbi:MAG TPA: YezD family protein [Opitutaceae bacterium]|nr:YezD family protein [Opitutaceae bacterium]
METTLVCSSTSPSPDWLAVVREKVEGLKYGVVQLVVHDGRVTQIERTEKTRLRPSRPEQD